EVTESAAQQIAQLTDPTQLPPDLHTTGTLNFTDLDITDANHTPHVTVAQTGTTNSSLTDAVALSLFSTVVTNTAALADGTIAWTFNGAEGLFDYLNNGEHLTLTYTVTVSDEALTSNSQTVTITINGANDAPVITSGPESATITENQQTSGTLNFTDLDITDANHTASVIAAITGGTGGTLTSAQLLSVFDTTVHSTATSADGTIDWQFNGADPIFDFLHQGQSVTITYTVKAADEALSSNGQTVTITVTGIDEDIDGPDGVHFDVATGTNSAIGDTGNLKAGHTIGTLTAFGDTDPVGGYTFPYALSGQNAGQFVINSSTGVLTVGSSNLGSNNYQISVVATDAFGHSSPPTDYTISVGSDANDNSTRDFSQSTNAVIAYGV